MIYWDVNHLAHEPTRRRLEGLTSKTTTSQEELSQKVDRLSKSLKGVSWADHLKSQLEFHNPHFFESVVEHFGIAKPLGSLGAAEEDVAQLQYYELELFPRRKAG